MDLADRLDEISQLAIAEDMEPWFSLYPGPPKDWDNAWKVLYRDGRKGMINVMSAYHWEHDPLYPEDDIVGYVRKRHEQ